MQADVDYLRLSIERQMDHWLLAVQNRANGVWLYRSRATNLQCGRYVLLDFTSSELGKRIREEDVIWVDGGSAATRTQKAAS